MKGIIVLLFFSFIQIATMSQNNTQLIYIGDPMCSWCYGLSNEFQKVVDQNEDKFEIKMLMGGLRPYNTETMLDLKDFLKGHWEHVNEASGQKFNYGILESSEILYDTEPVSRAVVVIKELLPEKQISFFRDCQIAFYKENKNPTDLETFLDLIKDYPLDSESFTERYNSDEAKIAVKSDFATASSMGIKSFPSIVLHHEGEYHLILNGFDKAEVIQRRIDEIIAN